MLDAPISKDGLSGKSVTAVVETFQAAKQQSAVYRQLIPCRSRETETDPRVAQSQTLRLPTDSVTLGGSSQSENGQGETSVAYGPILAHSDMVPQTWSVCCGQSVRSCGRDP